MAVSTAVRRIGAGVVAVALVAGAASSCCRSGTTRKPPPSCAVTAGTHTYTLDIDQAANSTTIAAVGKRLGLPDHAVTVALAAALQESRLHNLPYGDRDSLGLFQQRPSQGWGTATEILTPSYAAAAFFRALTRVPSWETLPITDAAQKVQRSGAADRVRAMGVGGAHARDRADRRNRGRAHVPLLARRVHPTRRPRSRPSLGNELGVSSLDATVLRAPGLDGRELARRARASSSASPPSRSTVASGARRPDAGSRRRPSTTACASRNRRRDLSRHGSVDRRDRAGPGTRPGRAAGWSSSSHCVEASYARSMSSSECEKSIGETVSGHSGGSTRSSTSDS